MRAYACVCVRMRACVCVRAYAFMHACLQQVLKRAKAIDPYSRTTAKVNIGAAVYRETNHSAVTDDAFLS